MSGGSASSRPPLTQRLLQPGTLLGLALFAVSLLLYVVTLAPSIVFADAGELVLATVTGGVAHPPGFPLYLVLGGWFCKLPIGDDLAFRLNLFSALLGALCAPVLYATVRRICRDAGAVGHVAGACGALLFATSLTFWRQATIPEVYTLNMLMTALLFFLTVVYLQEARARTSRARWALAGIGLAAGLGGANHLTLVLILPGIALLIALADWQGILPLLRRIWLPALTTLVGLCIYAVLPWRAHAEPIFVWGNPDTFPRFWRHITGWQYQVNFRPDAEVIERQFGVFLATGRAEVGLLPLLFLPLGAWALARRELLLAASFAVSFTIPFVYSLCYDIAEDQETYFLIPFQLLAIVAGVGAGAVVELSRRRWASRERAATGVAAAIVLLVAASPAVLNLPHADRSAQHEALAYGEDMFQGIEPRAVVFTRQWNMYTPTLYLQHLYGRRLDVDIVDLNLLRYSWYIPYMERAEPRVLEGLDRKIETFSQLQDKWENGRLTDPEEMTAIQTAYEDLIAAMILRAWAQERPVYATSEMLKELQSGPLGKRQVEFYYTPDSLAFRLHRGRRSYHPLAPIDFANLWEQESWDPICEKVRKSYRLVWMERGRYLERHGRIPDAIAAYQAAAAIPPRSEKAVEALQRLGAAPE